MVQCFCDAHKSLFPKNIQFEEKEKMQELAEENVAVVLVQLEVCVRSGRVYFFVIFFSASNG